MQIIGPDPGRHSHVVIYVYSEITWAVGIMKFTRHEVRGGCKNPKTRGQGIFAPTTDLEMCYFLYESGRYLFALR